MGIRIDKRMYSRDDCEMSPREPMSARSVRVPTALWREAQAKADAEGEFLSVVVRRALEEYVAVGRCAHRWEADRGITETEYAATCSICGKVEVWPTDQAGVETPSGGEIPVFTPGDDQILVMLSPGQVFGFPDETLAKYGDIIEAIRTTPLSDQFGTGRS